MTAAFASPNRYFTENSRWVPLITEMTKNEFIHYQSHMIGHVESVTIENLLNKSQGMCRGRPRTNKYHIEKIKTSKEEGKF